ncbi:MAG TPA: lysylphosphatidylglycerol synthase domain-containing protein, partial [Parvularculaceae bacterium]|nr:lysylphosphatidylglycerol synthase domain-containing protein [Parvularculaceae bacterium]
MASSADPALIALGLALSLAIAIFDAAYWAASLTAIGCRIAFAPALALSLVSTFFANLAPSNLGADLFRVLDEAERLHLLGQLPALA